MIVLKRETIRRSTVRKRRFSSGSMRGEDCEYNLHSCGIRSGCTNVFIGADTINSVFSRYYSCIYIYVRATSAIPE